MYSSASARRSTLVTCTTTWSRMLANWHCPCTARSAAKATVPSLRSSASTSTASRKTTQGVCCREILYHAASRTATRRCHISRRALTTAATVSRAAASWCLARSTRTATPADVTPSLDRCVQISFHLPCVLLTHAPTIVLFAVLPMSENPHPLRYRAHDQ